MGTPLPLLWSPGFFSHLPHSILGKLGDLTRSNYLMQFVWMWAIYSLSFIIHSLLHVGKNYSNFACPHKPKPVGRNHERCHFSPHSAFTEPYSICEASQKVGMVPKCSLLDTLNWTMYIIKERIKYARRFTYNKNSDFPNSICSWGKPICYKCHDAYIKKKSTLHVWHIGTKYVNTLHIGVFWN